MKGRNIINQLTLLNETGEMIPGLTDEFVFPELMNPSFEQGLAYWTVTGDVEVINSGGYNGGKFIRMGAGSSISQRFILMAPIIPENIIYQEIKYKNSAIPFNVSIIIYCDEGIDYVTSSPIENIHNNWTYFSIYPYVSTFGKEVLFKIVTTGIIDIDAVAYTETVAD